MAYRSTEAKAYGAGNSTCQSLWDGLWTYWVVLAYGSWTRPAIIHNILSRWHYLNFHLEELHVSASQQSVLSFCYLTVQG